MKNNWRSTLVLAISLMAGGVLHAAPPVGNWSFNSNGFQYTLNINVNAATGAVTGTIFNINGTANGVVKGFWNEGAQKLIFYRPIGGNTVSTPPDAIQIYTGYLFPVSASVPNGSKRLAGHFEFFSATNGDALRHIAGWYAVK